MWLQEENQIVDAGYQGDEADECIPVLNVYIVYSSIGEDNDVPFDGSEMVHDFSEDP